MTKPEFVHLHLHSEYSLLDGACRFDSLSKRVKELGMPAVALTDHGNLFGAVYFYRACKAAGIKPVIGTELYVAPRGRKERGESGEKRTANHLVLFAKDYEGYLNLCKLSSIGFTEGYYYKPRIDLEVLAQYSKGVIATTACLGGQIPEALVEGKEDKARKLIDAYLQIFGRENYYFEIQDHNLPEQKVVIRHLRELSKHYNVPLLATNDCHYLRKEDAAFHDILLCIQTGKTLQDQKRFKFSSDAFYLKTPEEMYELFHEMPEACRETVALAERCNCELKFKQRLLPNYRTPDGSTQDEYLRHLAMEGLKRNYSEITDELMARLDMELDCIRTMGFSSYFLVTWDFIHYAKVNDIPVGPGRGSAAGSLVAYCLGITDIDPIEHGLIFERFLNPERVSMPDIDIDFCFEKRGRVIDYVKQKYGERNVTQIITFGTLKPKNALRDVGRAMNVPLPKVDKVAKLIPAMFKAEKGKTGIDTALGTIPEFKELYDSDSEIRQMVDYSRQLEGMARHASTHAAGVVICDFDITDFVPIYKPADSNDIATQYNMTTVEEIGLLKMDFLGLKNLTIIDRTLKSIRKNYGVDIDWAKVPLTDPKTYEDLRAGKTFGVFQLESSGMTSLVKNLAPTAFGDLTALLALYRPGPLGTGMVDDYVECKHGRKECKFDHPSLEPILGETNGVILYQEQVMKIAQVMGGFSLGGADLMRRAMGKKKAEEMAKMRAKFLEGAAAKGIDTKLAGEVFNKIDYFAGYGFNKSHSAAYAVVSFRTAYLKSHYPVDYLAALMTNAIGDKVESMAAFFNEAKENGIKILPPDINESDKYFTVIDGKIRFGLAAVKNVGEAAVEAIIEVRNRDGAFKSFDDLCMRVDTSLLNSRMIECLIKVGAFDSLGVRRSQLLEAYQAILEIASTRQREKQNGQTNLFDVLDDTSSENSHPAGGGGGGAASAGVPLKDIPEIPFRDMLQAEKELIGHYVSGHPLDGYRCDIATFSDCKLSKIPTFREGREVTVVGMVSKITTKLDRNGGTMAFVELSDPESTTEVIFFRDLFEQARRYVAVEQVLLIRAKIDGRNGDNKLIANEAKPIEDVRERQSTGLEITLDGQAFDDKLGGELMKLLKSSPGKKRVRLLLPCANKGEFCVDLDKPMSVSLGNELLMALASHSGVQGVKFLLPE